MKYEDLYVSRTVYTKPEPGVLTSANGPQCWNVVTIAPASEDAVFLHQKWREVNAVGSGKPMLGPWQDRFEWKKLEELFVTKEEAETKAA